MQPQPLREINPGGRSGAVEIGGRHRVPAAAVADLRKPPRAAASRPAASRPAAASGGSLCEASASRPGQARAMSWTSPSGADAKRSATGNCQVVSCCYTPPVKLTTRLICHPPGGCARGRDAYKIREGLQGFGVMQRGAWLAAAAALLIWATAAPAQQLVHFHSLDSGATTLDGYLFPASDNGRHPAAVFL